MFLTAFSSNQSEKVHDVTQRSTLLYTMESPGFWPKGISCRPWLSRKQWDDKIARENTDNVKTVEEENWEITENDDD